MKIAVTSKGPDLDDPVDPRFGRAAYILVVDSETFHFDVLDNKKNVNALKGAGIQAAGMVSDTGAEVLITGFCGPNAFKVLNATKIKVASDAKGTVRDAIESFIQGKLTFFDQETAEGHW